MSWPVICVFTLTVFSGVTVPKALDCNGNIALGDGRQTDRDSGAHGKTPGSLAAGGAEPDCEIYQPPPATMASPRPIPSRVRSRFIA